MGAYLVTLLLSAAALPQDTIITYATPATRAVVARAAARHQAGDTTVTSYSARLRYRLSMGMPGRQWAHAPTAAVEEQVGTVRWRRPNDVRVEIEGRREQSRLDDVDLSSSFDRPWFVPRGAGDSLRIFSDDFPATGALHPLAHGAAAVYHYDLTDSLEVVLPGNRQLRIYAVEVMPKHAAPALVVGRLWIDAGTYDVVRFSFRYVGTGLFSQPDEEGEDSASARRINRLANQHITVDVDLEYGQQDGIYWMPFRQAIVGTVKIPLSGKVIPFQARTEFSDYEINQGGQDGQDGQVVAGEWPGGHFEIHRPADSVLARYDAWDTPLTLDAAARDDAALRATVADLARLVEELPADLTDRRALALSYERLSDAVRYNRVQGLSLGLGARVAVGALPFTAIYGTGRYGFSDERINGRLALVHDAPAGRFTLAGYHETRGVDPFSPGTSLANSASALFTAHDYGDYLLASGIELSAVVPVALATDLTLSAHGERQRSEERMARSWVNDALGGSGVMPLNPPVQEGDFALVGARLSHAGALHWMLAAEGMAGKGLTTGRLFGEAQRRSGGARGYTLRLKAGLAEGSAPSQLLFRLGGRETVRGFDYAALVGRAFWAAQLDVSPLRGTIRPVLFVDAGQAGDPDALFGSKALVGGGIGVSLYSPLLHATLIRLDLSHPITPDHDSPWRFDLVFSPVR